MTVTTTNSKGKGKTPDPDVWDLNLERFSRVYICPIQPSPATSSTWTYLAEIGSRAIHTFSSGKKSSVPRQPSRKASPRFRDNYFNATDIRSTTFTYGSSSMFADPTYQHIGIYNIDYTVVPEPGALEICSIIGVLAVWTSRSRKRQNHDADTSMTESPVSNETS